MYFLRRLIDLLFGGLATYRGFGEQAAVRRASPGVLVIPRFPPRHGLYPHVSDADLLVKVDLDGRPLGLLRHHRLLACAHPSLRHGTLTFRSVRGDVLTTVEIDRPDAQDCCVVVRYFPTLDTGRPRRVEVEFPATT